MSLPGFTADASLPKTVAPYSMSADVSDAEAVRLQQFDVNTFTSRGTSISKTPVVSGCFDIDYLPVCDNTHPATPFGRCCDFTHERVCNGRRQHLYIYRLYKFPGYQHIRFDLMSHDETEKIRLRDAEQN